MQRMAAMSRAMKVGVAKVRRALPRHVRLPPYCLQGLSALQLGVQGLAGLAAIATGLSSISSVWWGFALLEHFRMQYLQVLLLGLFFSCLPSRVRGGQRPTRTRRRWTWLWLIPLLLNLAAIAPLWLSIGHPTAALTPNQRLRLLYITLDHERTEVQSAVAYIQQQRADLIFLLEVTPTSLAALQRQLGEGYRLVFAIPRTNSHGSAWLVPRQGQVAIADAEIIYLPSFSDRPLLKGTIIQNGNAIDLLLFHAVRPSDASRVAFQRQELAALADWSRTRTRQLMVFGDFNSTPWYGPFRRMLAVSGLVNSQVGFGWQTTWTSQVPSPLRLAIDHSLHSPSIKTLTREIGPNIGSDHLPLTVDFGQR